MPQPIVDAVANDPYTKGDADISVTGLVGPPRIQVLTREHWDELEEDASDRIWSLLGQAVHEILHRANSSGIAEKRLYAEVLGWIISGQFDRLELLPTGILQDYKTTAVYAVKKPKVEWNCQLNCYRYLLARNGYDIQGLEIVAILKDWKQAEFNDCEDGTYPEKPVVVLPIDVWPLEKAEKYVETRVKIHQRAREQLPNCTSEERWAQRERFALKERGKKRAIKILDNLDLAQEYAKRGKNQYVEYIPPRFRRCEQYCSVAPFCDQWAEDKKKIEEKIKEFSK